MEVKVCAGTVDAVQDGIPVSLPILEALTDLEKVWKL
jgi:hypothetical protein